MVIPKDGLTDDSSTPARTARLLSMPVITGTHAADAGHMVGHVAKAASLALTIVNTAPADGSVLVDADHVTLDQVKAMAPEGAHVFEEQWYPLERARGPWHTLRAPAKTATGGARQ